MSDGSNASAPGVHELRLDASDPERLFEPGLTLKGGRRVSAEAESWIAEHAAAAPKGARLRLVLRIAAPLPEAWGDLPSVLRAHFRLRRAEEKAEINRVLHDGRIALLIGFGFLLVVNGLAEAIRINFERRFAVGIANGLEIFGWVAMWRPAELLLYDWFPALRKKKQFERLAESEIVCEAASERASADLLRSHGTKG